MSNSKGISIVLIGDNGEEIVPEFRTPLVHQFNSDGKENVHVDIHFENNHLTIRRNDASTIVFRRPSYCPFTNLYLQGKVDVLSENPSNSINIGVVILFESHDRFVLLTRRAAHMRTFPSCWVCPGGGIECGENLIEAGVRELAEEVGIEIDQRDLETSRILALWESAFPPELALGLPRRHHIVVYLHIRSSKTRDQFSIRVDPNEVDAYSWLNNEQIGVICKRKDFSEHLRLFDVHHHSTGLSQSSFDILSTADHNQKENLTNGTRFALEQLFLSQ